jgi:hypothetical protein
MPQKYRITRSAFDVAAICALTLSGCAAPMIPSPQLQGDELSSMMSGPVPLGGYRFGVQDSAERNSCEDRQRLQDYCHAAKPYVAGPFMHPGNEPAYEVQQATVQPPHSKFHPVPTRPVFETRPEYLPPQPMGVHLVPVPEDGSHSVLPRLHQPDLPLEFPPNPPAASSESMDASEYDEPGTRMPPPPSN